MADTHPLVSQRKGQTPSRMGGAHRPIQRRARNSLCSACAVKVVHRASEPARPRENERQGKMRDGDGNTNENQPKYALCTSGGRREWRLGTFLCLCYGASPAVSARNLTMVKVLFVPPASTKPPRPKPRGSA